MDRYSTRQAARKLGLGVTTLARYIGQGKVPTPPMVHLGGFQVHLWTLAEIEHVRQLLPKIANGRKTRYKKKQSAVSNQRSAKAKTKAQPGAPQPQHAKSTRAGGPKAVPHKTRKPKKKSQT